MNPAGISEVYSLLLRFDSSEIISGSSWTTGRNPWGISVGILGRMAIEKKTCEIPEEIQGELLQLI